MNKKKDAKRAEKKIKVEEQKKQEVTKDRLDKLNEFHLQQLNQIKEKNDSVGNGKKKSNIPKWLPFSPDNELNDRDENMLEDSTKEDNQSESID
jgi:hypothetical protein